MNESLPAKLTSSEQSLSQNMAEARKAQQFIGFMLDAQEYAFQIEKIQEIVIPSQLTTMPQVPHYVLGVTNLRGAIIPVIGLRELFHMPPAMNSPETRTIVVNVLGRKIGCLVDSVTKVIKTQSHLIDSAPEVAQANGAKFVAGFIKTDTAPIVLLNVEELLDSNKLEEVHLTAKPIQADIS